jgi:serine/threonine protein kinase
LAQDLKHDRKVAVKVLNPELGAVMGSDRFLSEIRTTANLSHPHILPLHDSGEADGLLFYVMPYVDGESLRERLDREGQLSVEEAVSIAGHVADALDSAHRQGVIHRDLKPANILFQEGEPVVADFGIALAVTAAGEGRLTETGLSLGTPYYMSPEVGSGFEQVSRDGGSEPVWGPEGQNELFYRGADRWMMAASYSADSVFIVEDWERLFDAQPFFSGLGRRNYDVSPSGDRFVMVLRKPDAERMEPRMFMIQNWFTELEELLGAGR